MNILFLLSHYPGYGGIEKVSEYIATYLLRHGYNIVFLSYGTNAQSLIGSTPEGIQLYFLPKPLNYVSNENTAFINDFLKARYFDFVILQDSYAPIEHILTEIDYPWREKLIVVEHNTPMYAIKTINSYFYYDKGLFWLANRAIRYIPSIIKTYLASKDRKRFLLNNCKKYILLSNSFLKEMHFIVGKHYDNKITSITNPLTIPEPTKINYIDSKKKQILFVGRMTNQKGFNLLIKVWKEFSMSNIDNWELVMLAAGADRKKIEQIINKEALKNIRIDNPTTEIYKYYEESAILIMTSIYEGFPLVLAEAMSRGCVPIAFDSFCSVHDIITDGNNGILIPPFNIKEYSCSLSNIVNDKELWKKMSFSALNTSKKFYLENIGKQWECLFNNLK